jgi:hypothetical protein
MTESDEVWHRIEALQGEPFETISGKSFTYEVTGNYLKPRGKSYTLSRFDFADVLETVPLNGPSEIKKLLPAPGYVWAILHDPRVRREDW